MGSSSPKREPERTKTVFLLIFTGCFLISCLVHLLFLMKSQSWGMPGFSAASYDTIIPRTFRMKRVEIDQKLLEEVKPESSQKREPQPVRLDRENPFNVDNQRVEKTATLLSKPDEYHMDQLQSSNLQIGGVVPAGNVMEVPRNMETVRAITEPEVLNKVQGFDELLNKGVDKNSSGDGSETSRNTSGEKAAFSNLDQLLSGGEVINNKTAPILMPTDLLFEYDSDTLKPAATDSLNKLGTLIEKNAQASFRIEGHTDSFGSDEYNLMLSKKRAEAVKTWLKQRMNIGEDQISTLGLGKSRLLVPATGTVLEQQLNRRVEIVITTR